MLPIEELVRLGEALIQRKESLFVLEAGAGGALQAALSLPAGASGWFLGGVSCYHDSIKTGLLGLDPKVLLDHGSVSPVTVAALARLGFRHSQADWVLVESGVYGPGGGSPEKPVGLVYLHVAQRDGGEQGLRLCLAGDRATLRAGVAQEAAKLLIQQLATPKADANLK